MPTNSNKSHIKMVTFNTLGTPFFAHKIAKRYEKIAEIINKSNTDIVCFQEVFTFEHLRLLKKFLPAYHFTAYKRKLLGLKGGLVIFSKLPLENSTFITYGYPKNGHVPLHTPIVSFGMLICRLKGLPLTIAATHLNSDILTHNLTPKERLYPLIRHQLREAAQMMNTLSEEKNAVLLMGDFNIAAESALYEEFMTSTGAIDIFKKQSTPTYFFERLHYRFSTPANNRIDFIFLKQNKTKFGIISSEHLFEKEVPLSDGTMSYLSDHIGLQITFSIN